jgi:hypothetical protein
MDSKVNLYHLGTDDSKSSALLICNMDYNMSIIQDNSLIPSGNSKLGSTTTKIDTAERSISVGRDSLQVCLGNKHHGILAGFTPREQS